MCSDVKVGNRKSSFVCAISIVDLASSGVWSITRFSTKCSASALYAAAKCKNLTNHCNLTRRFRERERETEIHRDNVHTCAQLYMLCLCPDIFAEWLHI